jgi:hypothetical protein
MNGSFFAMSDFEMINSSGRLISERLRADLRSIFSL